MANTLIPLGQKRTVELMSVAEDRPRARVVKNKKRHGLDKRSGALLYLAKPRGRVTGNSLHIPLGQRLSIGQRTLRMMPYAVLRTRLLCSGTGWSKVLVFFVCLFFGRDVSEAGAIKSQDNRRL